MLQEFPTVNVAVHKDQIIQARTVVRGMYMDEKIERYIVDLVHASRDPQGNGIQGLKELISFGASPRASISLALASKAYAFLQGRGYVIPEDVRAIAKDVLRHRIGLTYEAEAEEMTSDDVVDALLNKVLVP
jgi:MoxR-like ATPase